MCWQCQPLRFEVILAIGRRYAQGQENVIKPQKKRVVWLDRSSVKTSRAAPAIAFVCQVSIEGASSINPPRPVLTSRASDLSAPVPPRRCVVCASGQRMCS